MVKSDYYRRQADLCLQLALVQGNQKAAIWLVEFAEELMTKAEEAASSRSAPLTQVLTPARNGAASARL
jgi:hypothetical protein